MPCKNQLLLNIKLQNAIVKHAESVNAFGNISDLCCMIFFANVRLELLKMVYVLESLEI